MKIKIVNKKKFIKMLVVTILIVFVILFAVTTSVFSYNEKNFKKIYVQSGDTLWQIAQNEKDNNINYKDKDIRDIINNIKQINDLRDSNLKVGQILLILD